MKNTAFVSKVLSSAKNGAKKNKKLSSLVVSVSILVKLSITAPNMVSLKNHPDLFSKACRDVGHKENKPLKNIIRGQMCPSNMPLMKFEILCFCPC